jgi:hypothetical protein
MADEPEIVEPGNHAAAFQEPLRRVLNHYGCILAVDEDGRAVAKGTGVFVEVEGEKMVVTARHVVTADAMLKRTTYIMLPRLGEDGLAVVGRETIPRLFPFDLRSPVWTSAALDVAFLRAGEELTRAPEAKFFSATQHLKTTAVLRTKWKQYESATTSLPYFVLGFPNFGHIVKEESKIELLSALPLPAYVAKLEEHPWDGYGRQAPRLVLEVDAHRPTASPAGLEERHADFARRLFTPEEGVEPFGGYSGGPVVVCGRDGEHLIGIIHQGVRLAGGELRLIYASAWDDCLAAMAASPEWAALPNA